MQKNLLQTLEEKPLLGDGAMGTQLIAAGLTQGACGESWNLSHPERVLAVQRNYVLAGSDCLITNTFGGCRLTLERHGEADRVVDINRAAVNIARQAFGDRRGFVLGDIGPSGRVLKPVGDTDPDEVFQAFAEQARALNEAGADAIIIETQTSLEELGLAIRAARQAGASIVIASMAYDVSRDGTAYHTMMGVKPEQAALFMKEQGVDVAGLNCGTGSDMVSALWIVRAYRSVCDLPLIAQPNAGKPELSQGKTIYRETPEEMARGVKPLLQAGVGIIGSCCGSSPDHIRAIRKVVDEFVSANG